MIPKIAHFGGDPTQWGHCPTTPEKTHKNLHFKEYWFYSGNPQNIFKIRTPPPPPPRQNIAYI